MIYFHPNNFFFDGYNNLYIEGHSFPDTKTAVAKLLQTCGNIQFFYYISGSYQLVRPISVVALDFSTTQHLALLTGSMNAIEISCNASDIKNNV